MDIFGFILSFLVYILTNSDDILVIRENFTILRILRMRQVANVIIALIVLKTMSGARDFVSVSRYALQSRANSTVKRSAKSRVNDII